MRPIITIDSEVSKDLDDAFDIKPIYQSEKKVGWKVNVYITDVAKAISTLEHREQLLEDAEHRVTTLYAGGNAFRPMLPKHLSEDRFSLNHGEQRDTIRMTIEISTDGEGKLIGVAQDTIRTNARLSFTQVGETNALEPNLLRGSVEEALECTKALFNKRVSKQNILTQYDYDNGLVANEEGALEKVKRDEVNGYILIQELMILTNCLMAQWCKEKKLPIIYRNHEAKDVESLRSDISTALKNLPLDEFIKRTRALCGKAEFSVHNKGHVGLGMECYANFTSPIRRFPDLHNQFVINHALNRGEEPTMSESRCKKMNKKIKADSNDRKAIAKSKALKKATSLLRTNPLDLNASQLSTVIKHGYQHESVQAMKLVLSNDDHHQSVELWRDIIMNAERLKGGGFFKVAEHMSNNLALTQGVANSIGMKLGIDLTSIEKFANYFKKQTGKLLQMKTLQNPPKTNKGKNYKGQLFEFCQKHNIAPPEFVFEDIGVAGIPFWETTATMQVNGERLQATAKSLNKKDSAQDACRELLNSTQILETTAKANNERKAAQLNSNLNAKVKVLEYCQKVKTHPPIANFSQKEALWALELSYVEGGSRYAASAVAESKKQAEATAYVELYEKICSDNCEADKASKDNTADQPKSLSLDLHNPKGAIFELCAAKRLDLPVFTSKNAAGSWHSTLEFSLNGVAYSESCAMESKKKSERELYTRLAKSILAEHN